MDLRQLECFLAVVDHEGINAAARALRIPQPTMSQAIRSLERELGTPLFHRIGRGMVLTSAGHALVGPARQVFRDVATAQGSVTDAAGRVRGRVDIAAAATLSADPLACLVGAFRARNPEVTVRISDLKSDAAPADLIRDGHCEIVVTYLPVRPLDGLVAVELGEDEQWLVLPPGSAQPADPLPLGQIPDVPWVVVPRDLEYGRIMAAAIAEAGIQVVPSVFVEHRDARASLVMANVGATFLERAMAEKLRDQGAVVCALDPPFNRRYGLVYDPQNVSPAGRAFVAAALAETPDQ